MYDKIVAGEKGSEIQFQNLLNMIQNNLITPNLDLYRADPKAFAGSSPELYPIFRDMDEQYKKVVRGGWGPYILNGLVGISGNDESQDKAIRNKQEVLKSALYNKKPHLQDITPGANGQKVYRARDAQATLEEYKAGVVDNGKRMPRRLNYGGVQYLVVDVDIKNPETILPTSTTLHLYGRLMPEEEVLYASYDFTVIPYKGNENMTMDEITEDTPSTIIPIKGAVPLKNNIDLIRYAR